MADLQVKARNLCNLVSTTTLHSNVGGLGTFIRNNSIAVYMSGTDNTSGVYIAILPESPSVGETFTISFVPVCSVDNVLRLNLFGVVQTITYTSGQRISITFTTSSNVSRIIAFYGGNLTEKTVQIYDIQIESGSTAHNYQPYSSTGWVHSLRKLSSATEQIASGQTIYANGSPITAYTLKGNTAQNGTPTPSNPVEVSGVGVRTENLFNTFDIVGQVPSTGNGALVSYNGSTTSFIPINSGNVVVTKPENVLIYLMLYAANGDYIGYDIANAGTTINGSNISGYENARLARLRIDRTTGLDDIQIMLNAGSTAKPYEPYGFKIPISTLQTVNNYLGSIQSTRQIYKWVLTGQEAWGKQTSSYGYRFYSAMSGHLPSSAAEPLSYCSHVPLGNTYNDADCYAITATQINISVDSSMQSETEFTAYLAQQYANGTPVTVWYVLATPTTGIVNEPLMKIGTYADSISNAVSIPTTEGANSITVDTTVQPSEFTATWTGWHDSSVKEYDGSDWQ